MSSAKLRKVAKKSKPSKRVKGKYALGGPVDPPKGGRVLSRDEQLVWREQLVKYAKDYFDGDIGKAVNALKTGEGIQGNAKYDAAAQVLAKDLNRKIEVNDATGKIGEYALGFPMTALAVPGSAVAEGMNSYKTGERFDLNRVLGLGKRNQLRASGVLGVENPYAAFGVDMLTDPTTYIGAGIVKNGLKGSLKGGAKKAVKFDDLKNEKEFFRVIVGDDAYDDIVQSGLVRTRRPKDALVKDQTSGINLDRRGTTSYPSFSQGSPSLSYAKENPNHYIIRTSDPSIKASTSGRHGKGSTMFPTGEDGRHLKELPADKVQVYKHTGGGNYELVNHVSKNTKDLKSMTGNNGMLDPNVYEALFPAGAATGMMLNNRLDKRKRGVIPQFKNGGKVSKDKKKYALDGPVDPPKKNQPTAQDSLDLYLNSRELEEFYKDYEPFENTTLPNVSAHVNNDAVNDAWNKNLDATVSTNFGPITRGRARSDIEYRRDVDKNRYLQRELQIGKLNLNSPMALYDRRIEPTEIVNKVNKGLSLMRGDHVSVPMYDPALVVPESMVGELSSEEIKRRKAFALRNKATVGYPDELGVRDNAYKRTITKMPNPKISLVDYLKQEGMPISYKSRKELAQKSGIGDYKGTPEQNTKLLEMLTTGTNSGSVDVQGPTAPVVSRSRGQLAAPAAIAGTNMSDSAQQRIGVQPKEVGVMYEEGEFIKENKSTPGISEVMKKRKSDGQLIVVGYQNKDGKRIPKTAKLTKDFQLGRGKYAPQKMMWGGAPSMTLQQLIAARDSGDPKLQGMDDSQLLAVSKNPELSLPFTGDQIGAGMQAIGSIGSAAVPVDQLSTGEAFTLGAFESIGTSLLTGANPITTTLAVGAKQGLRYFNELGEQQRERSMERQSQDASMYNDLLDVDRFAKFGGSVDDNDPETQTIVSVQTEKIDKGETIVTPEGDIFDSHAKASHGKMKAGDITDFLPEGVEVFSERLKLNKSDLKEEIGYTAANYSEDKDDVIKTEKVVVGDFLKSGERLSDATRSIKRKFKVIDSGEYNELDALGNRENMESRKPIIGSLKAIAERKRESIDADSKTNEGVMHMTDGGGIVRNDANEDFYVELENGMYVKRNKATGDVLGSGGSIDELLASGPAVPVGVFGGPKISVSPLIAREPDMGSTEVVPVPRSGDITSLFEDGLSGMIDSQLDSALEENDENAIGVQMDKDAQRKMGNDLFSRIGNRNALSSIGQAAALGLNSTKVAAPVRKPFLASRISPDEIRAATDATMSGGVRIAREIRESGGNPNDQLVQSVIANAASRAAEVSGNAVAANNRIDQQNQQQIVNTQNENNASFVAAENATRQRENQKVNGIAGTVADGLSAANVNDANEVQFNVDLNADTQTQLNALRQERFRIRALKASRQISDEKYKEMLEKLDGMQAEIDELGSDGRNIGIQ